MEKISSNPTLLCKRRREAAYSPTGKVSPKNYLLNAVVSVITGSTTAEESKAELENLYKEADFASEYEAEEAYKEAVLLFDRFVAFELQKRAGKAIKKDEGGVVTLVGDENCLDAFSQGSYIETSMGPVTDEDGNKIADALVEIVTVKAGPKKAAVAAEDDIERIGLMAYGESLAPPGVKTVVRLTTYYLKKVTDRGPTAEHPHFDGLYDQDVAHGKHIQIHEEVITGGIPHPLSDREKETVDDYVEGKEPKDMTPAECRYCPERYICTFEMPPVPVQRKEKEKGGEIIPTPTQKKVTDLKEGNYRVVCPPGSGKTYMVVNLIKNLINYGINPLEILVCAFTNAAAIEIQERLIDTVPAGFATTIHAWCASLLAQNYGSVGYERPPKVIGTPEDRQIVREKLEDAERLPGVSYQGSSVLNDTLAVFSAIKAGHATEEEVAEKTGIKADLVRKLTGLFPEYEKALKERCLITHDDEERLVVDLLTRDPDIIDEWPYGYIIVDEAQDLNRWEGEIIKALASSPEKKLLVLVGDPDQEVMGFRGGSSEIMMNFSLDGEEVVTIRERENHRSLSPICTFSNRLLKKAPEEEMTASRPGNGLPVSVRGFHTEDEEMDEIVSMVETEIISGRPSDEIAILTPRRAQLVKLKKKLGERGIQANIISNEKMLDLSPVRAAVSAIRVVSSPVSEEPEEDIRLVAFAILRMSGKEEISELEIRDMAEKVVKEADDIRKTTAPSERKERLFMLLDMISPKGIDEVYDHFVEDLKGKTITEIEFFAYLMSRFDDSDDYRREMAYPDVQECTIHSAKAREYPCVIVSTTGLMRPGMSPKDIEAAYKLLYVGATRARDVLYVTGKYEAYWKMDPISRRRVPEFNALLKRAFEAAGLRFDEMEIQKEKNRRRAGK